MPTSPSGAVLSGNSYVAAIMREDAGKKGAKVAALIVRDRSKCTSHPNEDGTEQVPGVPTICTECAESWSWDYNLMFWRTAGGRRLAQAMDLDPMTAGEVLRARDGYDASARKDKH